MKTSKVLTVVLAAVVLVVIGCKQEYTQPAESAKPAEPAAEEKSPEAEQKPAEEKAVESEEPAPVAEPAQEIDRDKLTACYQEVYCAQKKGQMDKIEEIYKSHGFEKPEDFTKAWIEAAKDTEWITQIANTVGKKCQ